MREISQEQYDELRFFAQPEDQGQMIDVTYAIDWETDVLYSREYDRSDRSESLWCAELDEDDEAVFDPANSNIPRHGEWVQCRVMDDSWPEDLDSYGDAPA